VPAATAFQQDLNIPNIKAKIAHKKADKKQNKKIQKAQDTADKAHERIQNLKEWNQSLSDWNNSQEKSIDSVEGTVATIVAGVPAIIDGLTQLQTGLVAVGDVLKTTVSPALTALSNGLTQVGAGLTTLGAAYQAVEYGATKGKIVLPAPCGGTTNLTPALVTPDIPDDGNPAVTSGSLPINVAACPAVAGNIVLNMVGAIRSNESDGAATGAPVGQAGAFMLITCGSTGCQDGTGTAKAIGEIVCTAQTPSSPFSLPDGSTPSLPLVNIQQKVARTASGEPTASSPDILGGQSCAVKGGAVYLMTPTVQFVDIPTSLTPGGTE
jgi:hypothetical protein